MIYRCMVMCIFSLLLSGCTLEYLAESDAAAKTAQQSDSVVSGKAVETFWEVFHAGNYGRLAEVNELLNVAYLDNPNDPEIAGLIGFTHMWKVTERARVPPDPKMIDHLLLAEQYFADAESLAPDDARITGFLGSAMMAVASLTADKKKQVRGYFKLMEGVKSWPEFNDFTAGYTLNNLSPLNKRFAEGVELQWRNMEDCFGFEIERNHLNPKTINAFYKNNPAASMPETKARACYNSEKAPYNVEGFFMNMGDMLLKQGQPGLAKQAYETAAGLPDFSAWPYKEELNIRLASFEQRAAAYKKAKIEQDYQLLDAKYQMLKSSYGCMACHQAQSN